MKKEILVGYDLGGAIEREVEVGCGSYVDMGDWAFVCNIDHLCPECKGETKNET